MVLNSLGNPIQGSWILLTMTRKYDHAAECKSEQNNATQLGLINVGSGLIREKGIIGSLTKHPQPI